MKPLPLHQRVADHDYAWPWFSFFVVVRLAQIAFLVWLLIQVLRWGFA